MVKLPFVGPKEAPGPLLRTVVVPILPMTKLAPAPVGPKNALFPLLVMVVVPAPPIVMLLLEPVVPNIAPGPFVTVALVPAIAPIVNELIGAITLLLSTDADIMLML